MRNIEFYKDCVILPLQVPFSFGGLLQYRSPAGSFIVFGGICEYHVGQAHWTRPCAYSCMRACALRTCVHIYISAFI